MTFKRICEIVAVVLFVFGVRDYYLGHTFEAIYWTLAAIFVIKLWQIGDNQP